MTRGVCVFGDEDGQAAIMAVLLIAIAAVVIAGLRATQDEILAFASARSAGEAAVEGATAVIADAYARELAARAVRAPLEMSAVVENAGTREQARAAASDLSARNGGPVVDEITVACRAGGVDVAALARGVWFRARFAGPECFPR